MSYKVVEFNEELNESFEFDDLVFDNLEDAQAACKKCNASVGIDMPTCVSYTVHSVKD